MKFGIADYGLFVWNGGLYDREEMLLKLKEIGYNGVERIGAHSAADAIHKAGMFRRLGMDFSTCRGPDIQASIQWSVALGKEYVWLSLNDTSRKGDFDLYCRRANILTNSCKRWGIRAAVHNHLGQRIENQRELEDFLTKCPDAGIVFDTGHLAAAGGNPVEIVKKYHERICVMHLKDVFIKDENIGIDKWGKRLRFCELGGGNTDLNNMAVMKALDDVGYNGWIHVEHDTHLRDPYIDLKTSFDLLKDAGFTKK